MDKQWHGGVEMDKIDYIKSSFENVQNLIQFSDQKIGAVLVAVTITIGVFINQISDLTFFKTDITIANVLLFIVGLIFVVLNIVIFYIGLIKTIRPAFARHYSPNDYSLFYFDHIATCEKDEVYLRLQKIDQSMMEKEISDQLFEVSLILRRKNKNCYIAINLLFISIGTLCLFIIIQKSI